MFKCCCFAKEKVYVEEVVKILLPLKLERYQLTLDEYVMLRKSGVTDNEMEKRYLAGVKIK